ncbi:MAG: TIGR01212 family radical SAM protein [Spirochaetales bacterium]|nr:TIGR01212 family radical SAM protein [Spirochaetales bacterium]
MSTDAAWLDLYPEHTFNAYALYLKRLYGRSVYRVAVDAGFSCPNRGKTRSHPGCTYCDEYGSRAPYLGHGGSLEEQIEGAIKFLKNRYGAEDYILYFQAFSSTFGSVEDCRAIYDRALRLAPFKELVVSTRPDCISVDIADLLDSYVKPDMKVWVELGLQSASDTTLKRIRRGHTVATFTEAYRLLKGKGINVAVHLIFGLPGEGSREIRKTVSFMSGLAPDGIKIHNLHIPRDTAIHREFLAGELVVPSPQRHLEYVIQGLELLPPETIIMRLTCDTPPERLVFPGHFWEKSRFYAAVREEMRKRNTWQGRCYSPER